MKCFHHNDADGRCAGAIVNYALREKYDMRDFFEIDYKDVFPINKISKHDTIYIVDYSLKPEVMENLLFITNDIIWIDHHKTADEYLYSQPIKGLRITEDKKYSGCELAWMFLCPDLSMPRSVQLIGDRDKWAWNYGKETAHFNEGLKLYPHSPIDDIWDKLFTGDFYKQVVEQGETCIQYKNMVCGDYTKSYGWETTFEGHKCFANGIYMFGSEAFGNRIKNYDICLSYEYLGDKWIVGLYSEKVDVGEIAKKHGGGGHKGASGFVCDTLPFGKDIA